MLHEVHDHHWLVLHCALVAAPVPGMAQVLINYLLNNVGWMNENDKNQATLGIACNIVGESILPCFTGSGKAKLG